MPTSCIPFQKDEINNDDGDVPVVETLHMLVRAACIFILCFLF